MSDPQESTLSALRQLVSLLSKAGEELERVYSELGGSESSDETAKLAESTRNELAAVRRQAECAMHGLRSGQMKLTVEQADASASRMAEKIAADPKAAVAAHGVAGRWVRLFDD